MLKKADDNRFQTQRSIGQWASAVSFVSGTVDKPTKFSTKEEKGFQHGENGP